MACFNVNTPIELVETIQARMLPKNRSQLYVHLIESINCNFNFRRHCSFASGTNKTQHVYTFGSQTIKVSKG